MAQHIKNLLRNYIKIKEQWKQTLLENWPEVIGNLYNKVTLEKIYEDTLILGVYDSCWLQELYLLSPVLISTINKKLDEPRIKHLRFKQVNKTKNTKKQKKPTLKRKIIKKDVHLSSYEKIVLKKIDDPKLRDALAAFRIRCYRESS